MNVQQKTKGFTIIEVVLVLAIAALIFLLVFLALPALQRNQRDTQRRSDAGRVVGGMQSFQSNNNGTAPFSGSAGTCTGYAVDGTFISSYLTAGGSTFNDPSAGAYSLVCKADKATAQAFVVDTSGGTPSATWLSGKMAVVIGADCNTTKTYSNTKDVIYVGLEGGGSYCVNN